MKKSNLLALIGALGGISIIYETINAILDGISRTWTQSNTDMIARAIASGAWMLGLAMSVVILSVGAVILGLSGLLKGGQNRGQGYQDGGHKMIEGQTVSNRPYALTDNSETEYIGLDDAYQAANSYIDSNNNV